ncbi:MAG: hypothetical protein C5B51_02990, partial [Terriglobia bacterium]
ETKRPRSRRSVAVPAEVARLLADRIASQYLQVGRLLFESRTHGPIHERNLVQRLFRPLLELGGLPRIRLYDLRHTFATLALREGVPARLVSEQLGQCGCRLYARNVRVRPRGTARRGGESTRSSII